MFYERLIFIIKNEDSYKMLLGMFNLSSLNEISTGLLENNKESNLNFISLLITLFTIKDYYSEAISSLLYFNFLIDRFINLNLNRITSPVYQLLIKTLNNNLKYCLRFNHFTKDDFSNMVNLFELDPTLLTKQYIVTQSKYFSLKVSICLRVDINNKKKLNIEVLEQMNSKEILKMIIKEKIHISDILKEMTKYLQNHQDDQIKLIQIISEEELNKDAERESIISHMISTFSIDALLYLLERILKNGVIKRNDILFIKYLSKLSLVRVVSIVRKYNTNNKFTSILLKLK